MSDKAKGSKPSRKLIAILSAFAVAAAITVGCYVAQQQTGPQPPPPVAVATNQPGSGTYDSKTDPDRAYIYAGVPRSTDPKVTFTVLKNRGYLVGYNDARKDPLFAAYHLVKVVNPPTLPRPTKFTADPRTQAKVRSEDYARTGYDRGHMAPNHAIATRFGEEAQIETFLMTEQFEDEQEPGS